jgi:cyclopropane-fatty-acyl-phospholipid synthase
MSQKEEAARLYDERFCRMWEFYLASCEMAFRVGRLVVFQVQLAKRVDTLPLTRDYMFEAERASAILDHAASSTAADASSMR